MKRLIFVVSLLLFILPVAAEDLSYDFAIPFFNKWDSRSDIFRSDKIDVDKISIDEDGSIEYFPDDLCLCEKKVTAIYYTMTDNKISSASIDVDGISRFKVMDIINNYVENNNMWLVDVEYEDYLYRLSYRSYTGTIIFLLQKISDEYCLFSILLIPRG